MKVSNTQIKPFSIIKNSSKLFRAKINEKWIISEEKTDKNLTVLNWEIDTQERNYLNLKQLDHCQTVAKVRLNDHIWGGVCFFIVLYFFYFNLI